MTTTQRQITRAAGTVMAAFLLSNLVGLARQILITRAFGTGGEIDAFYAAQQLPDLLFNLVAGGALASAFVPAFTGFLTRQDQAGAWRLASGVVTLAGLVLAGVSALAAWLAPAIVAGVLAPGYAADPGRLALTVGLLRVLLLSPVIFGVSGLVMGILNAHQRFLLPALAPASYGLGLIFGLLVLVPAGLGIYGLAWGAVAGAALHLAVQLPGLRGLGLRFQPIPGLREAAVREVFWLMGPRLLGVAAVQLNFVVSVALASYMRVGSLTALNAARQVFLMPQALIAQAISIAALPAFSALVARGERDAMRTSLAETVRLILFLALPATVGLALLGEPVIAVLFERGNFDAASTQLVAGALFWFAVGLASHSVVEIVSRAYYALKDTWTPVWVGALAMGLNVGLNFLGAELFTRLNQPPHNGLALANTVATTLEMAALVGLIRGRLGGLEGRRIWPGVWRTALAAAGMGAGLALWLAATAGWPAWAQAAGGLVGGAGLFAALAYGLGAPEARQIAAGVGRRLIRRRPSPPPP